MTMGISRDTIISTVLAGGICFLLTPAAQAERVCGPPECSVECWWPGPNHRRCVRRCRRHCYWQPPAYEAPRYDPPPAPRYQPQPQPQYYHPAPSYRAQPDIPPELLASIVALIALGIAAIIAAATSSSTHDIAVIAANTETMRELGAKASGVTKDIDALIEDATSQAFQAGRRAADEEWGAHD